MREIQEHKIKIYEFPETDDEEENKLVKKIKVCMHQFSTVDERFTVEWFQTTYFQIWLNDGWVCSRWAFA